MSLTQQPAEAELIAASLEPLSESITRGAGAAGLQIVATGAWPQSGDDQPPSLAGFVESSFSPLVAETAERCLRAHYGSPPADPARTGQTAVVLVSAAGDSTTAVRVAQAVDDGSRVGPLLFFQSVPNAVLGYLAARWGLRGPVVSLGVVAEAFRTIALLIADGDADEALVVFAEQDHEEPGRDQAVAVLVRPVTAGNASHLINRLPGEDQ